MATENTMQINTFSKGMDTDTSDMYLDSQAYRIAYNLRITADINSTSGELTMIPGSIVKGVINDLVKPKVLATASVSNVGVILVKHEINNAAAWSVYRFDDGDVIEPPQYFFPPVFGPCYTPIANNFTNHVSLLLNKENDQVIKLYIADGEHSLMCINVASNTVYTDILSISSMQSGVNDPISSVTESTIGDFQYGVVQYMYRTYDNDGRFSALSSPTKRYAVYTMQSINGDYLFVGPDTTSSTTITVTVGQPDLYNNIQLFRILYKQNGTTPFIQLIADVESTSQFVYEDHGESPIAEYTLEELLSGQITRTIPKFLATKDNYLFLANVKYESDELYKDWDARSYSNGSKVNGVSIDLDNIPTNISEYATITNQNLNLNEDYDDQCWSRIGDTYNGYGIHVNWKYTYKEVPIPQFISRSTMIASDDVTGGTAEEKETNARKIAFERQTTTLKRNEVYRYGIVLYSSSGARSNVKWIADIRTPDCNHSSFVTYVSTSGEQLKARVLGIQFQVNGLPTDCIGYEIVRAKRELSDKRSISQGVLAATVVGRNPDTPTVFDSSNISTSGIPLLSKIVWGYSKFDGDTSAINHQQNINKISDLSISTDQPGLSIAKTETKVLQYYSPEINYATDDFKELIDDKIMQLSPAQILRWNFRYNGNTNNSWLTNNTCTGNVNIYDAQDKDVDKRETSFLHIPTVIDTNIITTYSSGLVFDYNRPSIATPNNLKQPSTLPDYLTFKKFDNVQITNNIRLSECQVISDLPRWNSFVNGETLQFRDHVQVMESGFTYNKWCLPEQTYVSDSAIKTDYTASDSGYPHGRYPVGIGGRSALLYAQQFEQSGSVIYDVFHPQDEDPQSYFSTLLVDICQSNVIPYNGTSISSLNNTKYISNGNFVEIQSQNNLTGTTIDVYDGDYFISTFEFVSRHNWYSVNYNWVSRIPQACYFPVETQIDLLNAHGASYSNIVETYSINPKLTATWIQDQADAVTTIAYSNSQWNTTVVTQSESMYKYHSAYSQESAIQYPAEYLKKVNNYDYNTRIVSSAKKTNGEAIDSWLTHSIFNYIDVDTNLGEVTSINTFRNKLLFLQESAFGELSVNERSQIIDENNTTLLLGTGGVLDRCDYIDTHSGLKKGQRATNVSKNAFYWWDADQLAINKYGDTTSQFGTVRYAYSNLSENKISSWLKGWSEGDQLQDDPKIHVDDVYSEVLFDIGDDSIVYNELVSQFSSLYMINDYYSLKFKDNLYVLYDIDNNVTIEQWNEPTVIDNELFSKSMCGNLLPEIQYVVNKLPMVNKVYDNVEFAGQIYDGGSIPQKTDKQVSTLGSEIKFMFRTPLNQSANIDGTSITNREYEYRFAVPRQPHQGTNPEYGNRLRGKTMNCTMRSTSNNINFSLQYIITKFRTSWT